MKFQRSLAVQTLSNALDGPGKIGWRGACPDLQVQGQEKAERGWKLRNGAIDSGWGISTQAAISSIADDTDDGYGVLTLNFLRPFTLWIPAANSGLSRPASAASLSKAPSRRQSPINDSRSELPIFEVNAITGDHSFVEGQSRFGAVPSNEFINSVVVASLRFRRPRVIEDRRPTVIRIGRAELRFRPFGFR
ncbi:MAG: hypothetical protein WB992_07240 [Bryobacteraceae bacterium]